MERERLSAGRILAYSLPAAPLGFMTMFVNLYLLKFTSDVLLIAPAVFGVAFGAARIWDAATDPLAGYWSDRTRSRLGRRRSWMLASALPLVLAFAAVWSPPDLGRPALVVWMILAILFYYSAYTIANVPHLALGAELSPDYDERSRISTGRGAFELLGLLSAAGAIAAMTATADERSAASWIAVFFAAATVPVIGIHVWQTRERPEFQGRGAERPVAAFADIWRNPHARILLGVFFIETSSLALLGVLIPFVSDSIGSGMNPGVALGIVVVVAAASIPFWLKLAERYGKRGPWMTGIAAKGIGFGLLYFIGEGTSWFGYLPMLLIGAGQACGTILPTAIKADVIDYDELRTGQRKEGTYFAVWNLATKLASAVAIVSSGLLLQLVGYEPNVAQPAHVIAAMLALVAGAPFVLHAAAFALLLRFRLDREAHAQIRRRIEAGA